MAETINTALDFLPPLTTGAAPLPNSGASPPANLFLNQLVNALSKSAAETPLASVTLAPEDLQTLSDLPLEQLVDGKSLPLDGKVLPPQVEKALAVIAGKSRGQSDKAPLEEVLPVHLFARELTTDSTLPGKAVDIQALKSDQEPQPAVPPADQLQQQAPVQIPPIVAETVLNRLSATAGQEAPPAVVNPESLLDRRLSGSLPPSTGRPEIPSLNSGLQTEIPSQTLTEVSNRAVLQSQTVPADARAVERSASIASHLDDLAGLPSKVKVADPAITEARPSLQSAAFSQALQQAAPSLSREPVIPVPQHALNDPQWSQAMGNRLNWMVQQGVQTATLQLVPENLGQIQVRVSVQGEMANIEFHARHSHTGDLIETMLPRLTAALDAQGVRVEEVKVSQGLLTDNGQTQAQNSQQGAADGRNARAGNAAARQADANADGSLAGGTVDLERQSGLSLLDAYA